MAEYTYSKSEKKKQQKDLDAQLQAKNKSLTKNKNDLKKYKKNSKKWKKLKASQTNILDQIKKIKEAQGLLAKVPGIPRQNIAGIRGSAKTVKIPGDNLFAVTTAGVPAEAMEKLFFDSIGTTEIINVERHDNINTPNAPYQPIVDIASINTEYNPNKIVSLQRVASLYFSTFGISFDTYEPQNGTGPNNEIVYVEDATGDLIINVLDLPQNFRVEVQVMSFEDILNDTVYGII